MTVARSNHAQGQRNDILRTIARELSFDDAMRWADKFHEAAGQLANFPRIGTRIPAECFHAAPSNADRLRQLVCKPYRIVYEIAESEIHVLSARHSRMLVTVDDTLWN